MLFRRRKAESNPQPDQVAIVNEASLLLETKDKRFQMAFPPDVVTNGRQMISRIETRNKVPKRLAFTSALRGEGVTFMSWVAGTLLAHDFSEDVCVVDLNWWHPNEFFSDGFDGLSDVLNGNRDINDVLIGTNYPNLVILPAGHLPINERSIASRSDLLTHILADLDERFNHLIFDIPSVLAVSESVTLASRADACCVVVHQGVTSSNNVRKAIDELEHLNVLGVVMNQVKTVTPEFLLSVLPSE